MGLLHMCTVHFTPFLVVSNPSSGLLHPSTCITEAKADCALSVNSRHQSWRCALRASLWSHVCTSLCMPGTGLAPTPVLNWCHILALHWCADKVDSMCSPIQNVTYRLVVYLVACVHPQQLIYIWHSSTMTSTCGLQLCPHRMLALACLWAATMPPPPCVLFGMLYTPVCRYIRSHEFTSTGVHMPTSSCTAGSTLVAAITPSPYACNTLLVGCNDAPHPHVFAVAFSPSQFADKVDSMCSPT